MKLVGSFAGIGDDSIPLRLNSEVYVYGGSGTRIGYSDSKCYGIGRSFRVSIMNREDVYIV